MHELVPLPDSSASCAAKGGLGLLTKCMALELAEHGIPVGRPGDARGAAALVAHLCSPDASYTTGPSFVVDGGLLLMAAVR